MIQFPCICGHAFSLDDDQAGGFVQCPACHRLNDVPRVGELNEIAADGTYKIEAAAPLANQTRVVADLAYIYQKGSRDAEGNEIDLRTTSDELKEIGRGEPIPLVPTIAQRKHAPRYDPETGELITEFGVANFAENPASPAEIPMAKPALNYASNATLVRPSFLRLFVNLFMPLNIAVMFAVLCLHVLLLPVFLAASVGILFPILAVIFLAGALLAHYGNVIEEIGPYERDELPRPMRDVSWHEDLWSPFCNVIGSLLICYGPAFFTPGVLHRFGVHEPAGLILALILAILGTFLFPAVVLTMQCSGTILNLRPDRILQVIAICGTDYFITLLVLILAVLIYSWGGVGTALATIEFLHTSGLPPWLISWTVTVPVLCVGIFLTHFFCVCVGLLYRFHYSQFPWILQRHERTKRDSEAPGLPPSRRTRPYASGRIEQKITRAGGRTARTQGPPAR